VRKLVIPAVVLTVLTGCAGPQDYNNTAQYGGIGALAGAVAGAAINHDNRMQGALIGGTLGAAGGAGIGYYVDRQEKELRAKLLGTGINVKRDGERINLVLPSDITFESGSYRLTPSVQHALADVAKTLQAYPDSHLVVTGHADSSGTPQANLELSRMRAQAVSIFLQSRGVDAFRLTTLAAGDSVPVAANNTAAGREANRRVEITLSQPGAPPQVVTNGPVVNQPYTQTYQRTAVRQNVQQAQPRYQYVPTSVFVAPYTQNTSQRILTNTVTTGVNSAMYGGANAGVRAGLNTVTRGVTNELSQGLQHMINNSLGGFSR